MIDVHEVPAIGSFSRGRGSVRPRDLGLTGYFDSRPIAGQRLRSVVVK
jgi:hypothetical protein